MTISRREVILATSRAFLGTALPVHTAAWMGAQSPSPGRRAGHAMAYHAGSEAVCLLGGDNDDVGSQAERLWLWDGTRWNSRSSSDGPPVRTLVAAAGDPERRRVLTFGGLVILGPRRYGPPDGDLWEVSADLTWRKHPADGSSPGPRHHHAMAFDTRRGRLVLYGGIDGSDQWPVDTWEWDRARWHRIATGAGPGDRAHHAMAYDSTRGRVVLRGGGRRDKTQPADTWEWDGTSWQQVAVDGPGPGNGYRMAFDEERRSTVLFGGDTCLWDGRAWTRLTTARAPAARAVHAIAFDRRRRRIVMYGGSVDGQRAADTWEWNGEDWTDVAPSANS